MTQTTDAARLELGLDTFGDVTSDTAGTPLAHGQVIRNLVEEAVLADRLGIGFIGVGEHHRADFAVSAPEIVLAAIAARTSRIRMGTAVTVLSSDDPVRLFQRFATLDALSQGRAEVILGRGSFTESFPLFGQDLSEYEVLFEEKLDLFTRLLRESRVTWSGSTRAALKNQQVFPTVESGRLTTWIGVGGSPESVLRAASHNLPLMLAIIGGDSARFKPFADLYRRAHAEMGTAALPIGVHSPGHVGPTDAEARDGFFPGYAEMHARIGASRGWPRLTRAQFDAEIEHGSLYVGSPETVARKIARTVRILGAQRFDLKYSAGPVPHELLMRNIELYGRKVIPMVREMVSEPA